MKPRKHRSGALFLLAFLLLAAGIVGTGIFYYRNFERQFRIEAEQQLAIIADLKVTQIASWRRERVADAHLLHSTPYVARRALDALADPGSPTTRQMFTGWLASLFASGAYEQALLLNDHLQVDLTYPEGAAGQLGEGALRAAEEALASRQVVVADLHREMAGGPVYLSLMVPLVVRRESAGEKVQAAGRGLSPTDRSAGVLVLQINAQQELYPLIQLWPTPSPTGETLLIRREGSEAVFLNELRFQTNTALTLRSPLANTTMPAVRAALGQQGIVEGRDYRDVPVLAALRAVPDSPWALVARRDVAEVYAPLRAQRWQVFGQVAILLFGAGAGMGLAWRQQQIRFLRGRARLAEALQASQRLLAQAEELGRVGGWEFDLATRSLTWTKTVYDIHELDHSARPTVDEGIAFYTPASRPVIARAVQRAIEHGESFDLELEIVTAKGHRRNVHAVGAADRARGKVAGFFQDISERKQAEASRQKFVMLADSSTEFIGMCDLDFRPHYVNPAGLRMVGLPDLAAACRVRVPDYFFPEDQRFIAEEFFPRVRREGHDEVEIRLRHFQTGEPIWMIYSLSVVRDASGEIVGWATVSRDITERKQAEESLFQSRQAALNLMRDAVAARELAERTSAELQHEVLERQRAEGAVGEEQALTQAIIDSIPGAFYVLDGNGRYARWNAYQRDEIVGEPHDRIAGLDAAETIHPDDRALVAARIANVLSSGNDESVEGRVLLRGGPACRWLLMTGRQMRIKGQPFLVGIGIDITARKRAEEETLRLLAELTESRQVLLRAIAEQKAVEAERERLLVRAEASRRVLLSTIEDQRRAEDQVQRLNAELEQRVRHRTAALEAANKELEAFSYSVSHDLRAPLRSIDGFSRIIAEDYAAQLDDEGRDHLNRIRTAARRMGQLIDDLLGLSRVGRAELRREPLDLSALVGVVAAELQRREPARRVEWIVADGLAAEADPRLVRIVLENLLGNAWKFTGNCPRPRIEVGVGPAERAGCFFIKDNGAGFDEAYAGKLFSPFQRLHSVEQFAGTGIGLATVQRIIHRHGGRLWAEGRVGQGATFYFTLDENAGAKTPKTRETTS